MNFIEKIIAAITSAFTTLKTVLGEVNSIASKYGPQLREFVIDAADEIERAIPDGGLGNVKLSMFDGALRVFVQTLKEKENIPEEEMVGIFKFAHFILEGYLASKKAFESTTVVKGE